MSADEEEGILGRGLTLLVEAVNNGHVTAEEAVRRLQQKLSELTLSGGGAAAAASSLGDSTAAAEAPSSSQKRGRSEEGEDVLADGAASEGVISFELSYGNLERAWLGSVLIETGGTVTLQVVSTDHFAEISRAKVRSRAFEVVRVWVTLSDGVNCAKCHVFSHTNKDLGAWGPQNHEHLFL